MFLRFISCNALFLLFAWSSTDCFAAITTEGDAGIIGGNLVVAREADGSLTITPPDSVFVDEILIADQSFSNDFTFTGVVTVDNASLTTFGDRFVVGGQGNGTLNIDNGGRVATQDFSNRNVFLAIGQNVNGIGSVRVRGEGSQLDLPEGFIAVGIEGAGSLLIEDGGHVHSQFGALGANENGSGIGGHGSATIRGVGSAWVIGDLSVGNGATGTMRIEEGGLVRSGPQFNDPVVIGGGFNTNFGPSSGTVAVTGIGSRWIHEGELAVGVNGDGNINVANGGFFSSGFTSIAGHNQFFSDFGNNSGIVTVDGPGSQWNATGIHLGENGTGRILLSNGGKLVNNAQFGEANGVTIFGIRPGSFGQLVVDGATTQWIDNSQELLIGSRGAGELVIQNGAVVSSTRVRLAQVPEAHGAVRIVGPGSRWQVNELIVGEIGTGEIEVSNDATLQLTPFQGGMRINPQGKLQLDGGTIFGANGGTNIINFGLLSGHGEIYTPVENTPFSQIRVDQQQKLLLAESFDNQGGRVDVLGGEFEVRGSAINDTGGVIAMEGATLRFSRAFNSPPAQLTNFGDLIVATGLNRVHGDVENANSGSIILSGNSQTTFYDDIQNDGTINVSTGSVATFFGMVSGNGVGGGGTVFLEGPISPGFSPGVMAFGGNVTLGDFSQLQIEITGEVGDQAHDALDIVGEATLGGDLILNALEALAGDTSLEILAAESVEGTFDSVPELGEALGFGVLFGGITYNAESVVVSLLQQTADFNLDGSVDDQDLGTWATGFGTGTELANGDADRDGDVDGGDFLAWQRGFGGAATAIATQTIPEPTGLILIAVAGMMFCLQRP